MGLEKTRALNYDLSKLLYGIDEGRVALPDFQRDFDWTTNDVRSLLATVLSGWPIGSLLLIASPPQDLFELRAIEKAPQLEGKIETVVLDGQQRLTGMYQAFFGRGNVRYGLRVDVLDDEQSIDSLDEAIIAVSREEWEADYSTPAKQLQRNTIPMTALREAAEFFEWRDSALETVSDYTGPNLTKLYRDFLHGLHKYEVPAVVLDSDVPPAGIARIFERVNRTGLSLGTFDLVVAKSFTRSFNLRVEWERARAEYPVLDAFFGGNGLEILNVIALRMNEDVRQKSVLSMSGAAVRDNWTRAVAAMDDSVRFLSEHFGVWQPDWLPYRSIPTVLAGISYDEPLDPNFVAPWFWKLAFERHYDVASNTRSVSDYKALASGRMPGWVEESFVLATEDLLECNRKQSGTLHRAVICVIAAGAPKDLINGVQLNSDDLRQGVIPDVQFVSVFPPGYAPDVEAPAVHLRTLGMGLVERGNARRVKAASWEDLDDSALSSQLMPAAMGNATHPLDFIQGRLAQLIARVHLLSGRQLRLFSRSIQ